jgi:transposase InsO family protein
MTRDSMDRELRERERAHELGWAAQTGFRYRYRTVPATRGGALKIFAAIFEYSEIFHNRQRLHQTLDFLSPVEVERRARVS